jgi:hypothetical protein
LDEQSLDLAFGYRLQVIGDRIHVPVRRECVGGLDHRPRILDEVAKLQPPFYQHHCLIPACFTGVTPEPKGTRSYQRCARRNGENAPHTRDPRND